MQENSKSEGYEVIEIPAIKWGIFTTEPYKVENASDAVQAKEMMSIVKFGFQ